MTLPPAHDNHARGPIPRDPVDLDLAVELMPAWADPAAVAGLTGDPPYRHRSWGELHRCDDPACAVEYDDGPTCWACGGPGSTVLQRTARIRNQQRGDAA